MEKTKQITEQKIENKWITAQSFKLQVSEVINLNDRKLISLAQVRLVADKKMPAGGKIRARHPTIPNKVGNYAVDFILEDDQQEVLDEITVEMVVKSRKKTWFSLLSMIVLAALLSGLWLFVQQNSPQVTSGLPRMATEKMTDVELKKYANKKVDESNVTINAYSKIKIENDGRTGKMWVQNLPVNKTGQVVTLKDRKTGEILFTSDLLRPGYQVTSIILNKKLSEGTHKGLITLSFYDLKEEKLVGQTDIEAVITAT